MSLFQNTVTLFYVISLVWCVSSFMATSTEVTAVTEIVKDNDIYHIIMSAFLQRVNMDYMDYVDGGKEKARIKKSTELEKAFRMPPRKLMRLAVLVFKNMLLKEPIDGVLPLDPEVVGKTVGTFLLRKLGVFKFEIPTTTTPKPKT